MDPDIEKQRLEFEIQKHKDEVRLRELEFTLGGGSKTEPPRPRFAMLNSPFGVAIIAAIATVASAAVSTLQGYYAAELAKKQHENELALEKRKHEMQLIADAVAGARDDQDALRRLAFLGTSGLLSDLKAKLKKNLPAKPPFPAPPGLP